MYELFDETDVLILGHRGCCERFPENTMVSFRDCASDERINGIELDVHLCKSGEVVVAHDHSLKRTAGIDRNIEDMTWDELCKVDVGSFKGSEFAGEHIPLLSDLFEEFGDRFCYDIELKVKPGHVNKKLSLKVWDLVCGYNLGNRVMVSSFNPWALRKFNRICWYSVPTADIFDESNEISKPLRKGFGHIISGSSFLKPHYTQVGADYVEKKKMPVITWTVNTAEDAEKLLQFENVKGLIGNNPHLLADVLESINKKK